MASPNVKTGQTDTFQFDGSNVTSFEVTRPASLTIGNTLLIIFVSDGNVTIDMTADGLTQLGLIQEGTVSMRVGWRKIDGLEPATFTITTSAGQRACATSYEIENAADPSVTSPEQSSTTGASTAPDSPIHTPSTGTDDYLWVAGVGIDRDKSVDGFPTNMTTGSFQLSVTGGGANSCSVGSDTHEANGSDFNPDAFLISASEGWCAATVSIAPVSPDATPILTGHSMTLAQGTVATLFDFTQPITGHTATLSLGNPTPVATKIVTGHLADLQLGAITVDILAGDITAILTGHLLNLSQGIISPSISNTLIGHSADLQLGNLTNTLSSLTSLTGHLADLQLGTLISIFSSTAILTGHEANVQQGSLNIRLDTTQIISSQQAILQQGTILTPILSTELWVEVPSSGASIWVSL